MNQVSQNHLIIRRLNASSDIVRLVTCKPGEVTVLKDEIGNHLYLYQQELSGQIPLKQLNATIEGKPFNPKECAQIGFSQPLLNVEQNAVDYMIERGIAKESVFDYLASFGLEKCYYLACKNLNGASARQIELLALTLDTKKVWILNDPFSQLSGRWTERFAELVLEEAKKRNLIVVVTGVINMPIAWTANPAVIDTPVGKITDKAKMQAQEKKLEDLISQLSKDQEKKDEAKNKEKEKDPVLLPDWAFKAYKGCKDWIIEPLANTSNMLRLGSAPGMIGAMALLLVLMVVVMFPDISVQRMKLSQIGEALQGKMSWSQVLEEIKKGLKPVAPEELAKINMAPDEAAKENLPDGATPSDEEVEDPGITTQVDAESYYEESTEPDESLAEIAPLIQSIDLYTSTNEAENILSSLISAPTTTPAPDELCQVE